VTSKHAGGAALGRERQQELARRVADHLARPLGGERGAAREVLQRQHLGDGEVVVARQADRAVRVGQLDAGVGVAAVAHEVPEAPELVDPLGLGGVDHRLEGVLVAVDV
jgi:hypothetical protein